MRFCGFIHPLEVPKRAALADNIKKLSPQVWEKINHILLGYAKSNGVEDGQKVRIDPTVTKSNILHPTDNGLLFDCVEVFGRLLERARKNFGIRFRNLVKSAKRYHMEVVNAKNNQQRTEPYKKLLKATRRMIRYAELAVSRLRQEEGVMSGLAHHLADQLDHYLLGPLPHRPPEHRGRLSRGVRVLCLF